MKPLLEQTAYTKISLPNKNQGSKDYGKKINLQKLHQTIQDNRTFKTNYDTDSNPYQNYIELTITGKARIYSNGTITSYLNLPKEALIEFYDKFYKAYVRDTLEN